MLQLLLQVADHALLFDHLNLHGVTLGQLLCKLLLQHADLALALDRCALRGLLTVDILLLCGPLLLMEPALLLRNCMPQLQELSDLSLHLLAFSFSLSPLVFLVDQELSELCLRGLFGHELLLHHEKLPLHLSKLVLNLNAFVLLISQLMLQVADYALVLQLFQEQLPLGAWLQDLLFRTLLCSLHFGEPLLDLQNLLLLGHLLLAQFFEFEVLLRACSLSLLPPLLLFGQALLRCHVGCQCRFAPAGVALHLLELLRLLLEQRLSLGKLLLQRTHSAASLRVLLSQALVPLLQRLEPFLPRCRLLGLLRSTLLLRPEPLLEGTKLQLPIHHLFGLLCSQLLLSLQFLRELHNLRLPCRCLLLSLAHLLRRALSNLRALLQHAQPCLTLHHPLLGLTPRALFAG
mmetsp:Transcript_86816/g.202042  ORF Transcript_86816/g.202042 Transcript_86816/m.202042 type:complete len:404 (+) Transcript_86816:502-1713(+)